MIPFSIERRSTRGRRDRTFRATLEKAASAESFQVKLTFFVSPKAEKCHTVKADLRLGPIRRAIVGAEFILDVSAGEAGRMPALHAIARRRFLRG
jgi:hypothetical protein